MSDPLDLIDAAINAIERLRVASHLINHRQEFASTKRDGYLESDITIAGEIIERVVAELRASVNQAADAGDVALGQAVM